LIFKNRLFPIFKIGSFISLLLVRLNENVLKNARPPKFSNETGGQASIEKRNYDYIGAQLIELKVKWNKV